MKSNRGSERREALGIIGSLPLPLRKKMSFWYATLWNYEMQ
jgi:hypothetical protein